MFRFSIPWIVMQLLTGLLIMPRPGAVLIAVLPADRNRPYRSVALAAFLLTMLFAFYVLSVFDALHQKTRGSPA
jgi:NADH:ubiquinone oxidoreductase subunit 4 (subunit M)